MICCYLFNQYILSLVSLHCTHQPINLQKENKTSIRVQNHPCGTVGAKVAYELGHLVHGNIVFVFDKKEFLMDCLF